MATSSLSCSWRCAASKMASERLERLQLQLHLTTSMSSKLIDVSKQHLLGHVQLVLQLPLCSIQQGPGNTEGRLQLETHALAASAAREEVEDERFEGPKA